MIPVIEDWICGNEFDATSFGGEICKCLWSDSQPKETFTPVQLKSTFAHVLEFPNSYGCNFLNLHHQLNLLREETKSPQRPDLANVLTGNNAFEAEDERGQRLRMTRLVGHLVLQ